MVWGIPGSIIRTYLIRPDKVNTEITKDTLNTYSDYNYSTLQPNQVWYLHVSGDGISETEEKKVKITRFVNRGCVVIDLREQYNTITFKDIYLGRTFGGQTESTLALFRRKTWKYAMNEWNKISPGKTACKLIHLTMNGSSVQEIHSITPYSYSYKNDFLETFYIWPKAFTFDIDAVGQTILKSVSLEEKL